MPPGTELALSVDGEPYAGLGRDARFVSRAPRGAAPSSSTSSSPPFLRRPLAQRRGDIATGAEGTRGWVRSPRLCAGDGTRVSPNTSKRIRVMGLSSTRGFAGGAAAAAGSFMDRKRKGAVASSKSKRPRAQERYEPPGVARSPRARALARARRRAVRAARRPAAHLLARWTPIILSALWAGRESARSPRRAGLPPPTWRPTRRLNREERLERTVRDEDAHKSRAMPFRIPRSRRSRSGHRNWTPPLRMAWGAMLRFRGRRFRRGGSIHRAY